MTLEGPRGYFPVLSAYLAALPGHRGSIEKYGDKWTEAANIVCNGPFVLEAWEHNKVIVLKKNKHFFGAKDVTLEKVTIPIIPIASGALPYENNEIDLTRAADRRPQAVAVRPEDLARRSSGSRIRAPGTSCRR